MKIEIFVRIQFSFYTKAILLKILKLFSHDGNFVIVIVFATNPSLIYEEDILNNAKLVTIKLYVLPLQSLTNPLSVILFAVAKAPQISRVSLIFRYRLVEKNKVKWSYTLLRNSPVVLIDPQSYKRSCW